MSPTKTARQPKRTLTIDFAGICTFVWDRKAGYADVRLVDLASAGFERHYAALGVAVGERTPKAIKGPEADAAISLPDSNTDVGLWSLKGCDVQIVGALGKLTVDDSKVDVTSKPPKTATSIKWLPDIGFLTESTSPNPICPTAATVHLPAGQVTANAEVDARQVEFSVNGTSVGPTRFCVPRLRVTLPFAGEIALVLDRHRVLRVSESMSVVISNTCVCAVGRAGLPNHFYAHYDVVRAKRRPTVQSGGMTPLTASFPEFCYMGFVEK